MDMNELSVILWQASIKFVKANNTMIGNYTYNDLVADIHMAARRRHVIGDLQLFDAIRKEGYTEAVFMFSPNFLNRNANMVFNGMGGTKWILELPDPISRVDCKEEDIDWEEVSDEILEKVAGSKVRIVHCEIDPTLNHKTLSESLADHD